jgi:N-acetylneuraminic acid mutarotase
MIVIFQRVFLLLAITVIFTACSGGSSGVVDTTPPILLDHTPSDNALSIDHEPTIYIVINENIDHASVNSTTFSIREGNTLINGSYQFIDNYSYYEGCLIQFIPDIPLDGSSTYNALVTTGITDLAGNHLSNGLSWSFTTAPSGTGTWVPTSLNGAPEATHLHSSVWTGNEILIWGGTSSTSTGYRYNPSTDSWSAMSTQNAPSPRTNHTAIWTGTEMIIWGGRAGSYTWLNDGARYNPSTDTWQSISLQSAPEERAEHSAVWTGTLMLIWGGRNGGYFPEYPQSGGIYNPSTDTWEAITTQNAPSGRRSQSAVWSGTHMLIWGGRTSIYSDTDFIPLASGGSYDPATDTWTATSSINAPAARAGHSAIWSGSDLIVWGGYDRQQYFSSGGKYNPFMDTWVATSMSHELMGRYGHGAVWTGSNMIIWGGYTRNIDALYPRFGGIYDPINDVWSYTVTTNAPDGRTNHTNIWTGNEMIVWGGIIGTTINTGGIYLP